MNRRSFLKYIGIGFFSLPLLNQIRFPESELDAFERMGESNLTVEGVKEAMESMRKFKASGDYIIGYSLDDGTLVTERMLKSI